MMRRRRVSRASIGTSSISAPARLRSAGMAKRPETLVGTTKADGVADVVGHQRVVDVAGGRALALEADAAREIALRVGVDEEDALVGEGEGGAEVDGGGGFADAAFLVGDGEDSAHEAGLGVCRARNVWSYDQTRNAVASAHGEDSMEQAPRDSAGGERESGDGVVDGRFHVERRPGCAAMFHVERPGGGMGFTVAASPSPLRLELEHLPQHDEPAAEILDERPGGFVDERRGDKRRRVGAG